MKKEIKAILIDPKEKTVSRVYLPKDDTDAIDRILGCSTFTVPCILEHNDSLYIDDEGLFKDELHFFMLKDYAQPIAGRALIIGCDEETGDSKDCVTDGVSLKWLTNDDLKHYMVKEHEWATQEREKGTYVHITTLKDVVGEKFFPEEYEK